jgi:hypothetical protein
MFPAGTPEHDMASVIWRASRDDEGSISAAGADWIASQLVAAGYGKISQEKPQEPLLVGHTGYNGLVYEWPDGRRHYVGLKPPTEHKTNDTWVQRDPFTPQVVEVADEEPWAAVWDLKPGRIMEMPPNPLERIADALEQVVKHGIRVVTYNGGDA